MVFHCHILSILEAFINHKLQPKLLVIYKSQLLQVGSDCKIPWQRPKRAVISAKPLIVVSHLCQGTAVAVLAGSRTLSLMDKPCCHMASYHILVRYWCQSPEVMYKELISYICISWSNHKCPKNWVWQWHSKYFCCYCFGLGFLGLMSWNCRVNNDDDDDDADDDDIDDVVTARCYTGACRVLFNNKGSGVPPYKAPLAPVLLTRG